MSPPPNTQPETEDFEFAALNKPLNYRQSLVRDFSTYLKGQVLKVGAGIGQITGELNQVTAIKKLVSIEPAVRFYNRLCPTFPKNKTRQSFASDLPSDGVWNAILNVNVLEHIEHDEAELATYRRLLAREKGALCFFVPPHPEIYAPIDKDFGHFRRYTKPELRAKLERAGFQIAQLRYYNVVGYFAWWWSFCIMKNRGFNPCAQRLFDRVIFPAFHGFESRICAPPIGQSLLAVALAK